MGTVARLFGLDDSRNGETYEERMARLGHQTDIEEAARQEETRAEELTKAPRDDPFTDNSGRKIIPDVQCTSVSPRLSGHVSWLELWATIENRSPFKIRLIEVSMLGGHERPSRTLLPGERYEVRVYHGQTPTDDRQRDAYVRYEIADNGDEFETRGKLDFRQEEDYYVPQSYSTTQPPRDI